MISYRIPLNISRHILINPLLDKNVPIRQITVNEPKFSDSLNPLEMLDIFEHGRQIKVLNRAINTDIVEYLAFASPKLGDGFQYLLRSNESISTKIIKENALPKHEHRELFLDDIDYIAQLYIDLLGCSSIGIRLEALSHAMCPKFHIDRTGIRLLCTYQGLGTEWLDDQYADRTKLGMASINVEDSDSGLILDSKGIHRVGLFGIALLKGSLWQGNATRGIIHRSPVFSDSKPRIMLAIDAIW